MDETTKLYLIVVDTSVDTIRPITLRVSKGVGLGTSDTYVMEDTVSS